MATYVVGDVQGCLEPLQRLLQRIHFSTDDQLWLAGDLVNRGPDSLGTLRFVRTLDDQAVCVLGNHDLHLLALYHGHSPSSPDPSLDAILAAPDVDELMGWLQQQPLLHYDARLDTVMTHAGIPPIWDLAHASRYAQEVADVLRSPQAEEYFAHMYGNLPDRWHDQLTHTERWRCITNYLTRMRFLQPNGALEFATKCSPLDASNDLVPWFQLRPRVQCRQVFGHWAALEGHTGVETVVSLDMGCVWGGKLKMLCLDTNEIFTHDCA